MPILKLDDATLAGLASALKTSVTPAAAATIEDLAAAVVAAKDDVETKAAGKLAATAARQAAGEALDVARTAFQANQNETTATAYILAGQALTTAQAEDDAASTSYQTARRNAANALDALTEAMQPYIVG